MEASTLTCPAVGAYRNGGAWGEGVARRVDSSSALTDASESGTHRANVIIDERVEWFEMESEERPNEVVLDPDEWVLKESVQ